MNRRNFISTLASGFVGAQLFLPKLIKPHWKCVPFKSPEGIFYQIIVQARSMDGIELADCLSQKVLCSEFEATNLAIQMAGEMSSLVKKPLTFSWLSKGDDSIITLTMKEKAVEKPPQPEPSLKLFPCMEYNAISGSGQIRLYS
jgi:hypothetical protein